MNFLKIKILRQLWPLKFVRIYYHCSVQLRAQWNVSVKSFTIVSGGHLICVGAIESNLFTTIIQYAPIYYYIDVRERPKWSNYLVTNGRGRSKRLCTSFRRRWAVDEVSDRFLLVGWTRAFFFFLIFTIIVIFYFFYRLISRSGIHILLRRCSHNTCVYNIFTLM